MDFNMLKTPLVETSPTQGARGPVGVGIRAPYLGAAQVGAHVRDERLDRYRPPRRIDAQLATPLHCGIVGAVPLRAVPELWHTPESQPRPQGASSRPVRRRRGTRSRFADVDPDIRGTSTVDLVSESGPEIAGTADHLPRG